MEKKPAQNTYLQQVLQEQEEVNLKLQKRRSAPEAMMPQNRLESLNDFDQVGNIFTNNLITPSSVHIGKAIEYRITGLWIWKSVVVPPNVYVVHTRRGYEEPLHIGRGISFPFNPLTDAFLIIPSAVQTILINANCICSERQGILVQAYVQWIIDDLKTAYWKLDFSDPEDPMGIVNIQLREQAEAAIKDKVATMSIDEVLTDKQPIIEELTHRLQTVAEGSKDDQKTSEGLGLKIVTVQIKEAVVSSAQLWQNLQIPFRAEREKLARLAELENSEEIKKRELENRVIQERNELNAQAELDNLKATQEQNKYDREHREMLRRNALQEEGARQKLSEENATFKAKNQAKLELKLQELELEIRQMNAEREKLAEQMLLEERERAKLQAQVTGEIEIKQLQNMAMMEQQQRELELEKQRKDLENNVSEVNLQAQLIQKLPEIAENLPVPNEQKTMIITNDNQEGSLNSLLGFISGVLSLIKSEKKEG